MAEPSKTNRLTLVEAAALLGMTQDSVRRRILQGHLEGGQELGRWWYVTQESVDRYLTEQQATAAESA